MEAADWKDRVTGSGCPRWCTAMHDEDPTDESIVHVSDEVAFELPPIPGGTRYTLALATSAQENVQDQVRETALHPELRDQNGLNALADYVPVRTWTEVGNVAADLEAAAAQLRAWSDRLPA
ncbi:DUF6907 domain-containing protein [Streptomyces sp. NPDC056670]|uniref:DUF6907 domain-containing protein n=1 Tax=Streptomyces sp. NPDC056670 TaxID=3345904 RepID=UPI0036C45E61